MQYPYALVQKGAGEERTVSHLPDDLPVSHILPPITRIPRGYGELSRFVAVGTRPWGGEAVDVPIVVTVWLWVLFAANTGFGTWLTAVVFADAPCSGLPCTVATWDRPALVLILSAACVVAVAAVSTFSRGLTNAAPVPLAILLTGGACGLIAVAGATLLLALVVAGFAVIGGVIVAVIDRL